MRIDARPEFLKLSYKNLVIEDVERSLGLRDWDFRLATRHHSEPAVPRILQPVRRHRTKSRSHHHGHANIGVACHFCAVKSGRRDADDANRMVIQDYILADDRRIAAESPLPVAITQDGNGMRARCAVVLRPNQAAKKRLHAQCFKIISGNHLADGTFALSAVTCIEVHSRPCQNICKDRALVAHGLIHRIGKVFPCFLRAAVRVLDDDEIFRMADREIAEQNGVDQREEARVRANTQRQRQNCYGRETRAFEEHAKRITQVLGEGLEERQAALFAVSFLCLLDAAEVAAGGVASFFGTHAAANVFLYEHFQMRLKLGVELNIQLPLAEESAQTRAENSNPLHIRLLPYRREGVP